MERLNKNFISVTMLCLNAFAFCFILIYACVRQASVAANVFGTLTLVVFAADMLYGVYSKSKFGLPYIGVVLLLFAVNYGCGLIVALSVFKLSMSIVGIVSVLAVAVLGAALNVHDILTDRDERQTFGGKVYPIVKKILLIVLPVVLIVTFAVSISSLTKGETVTVTVSGAIVLMFLSIACACAILRIDAESPKDERKNEYRRSVVVVSLIAAAVSIGSFAAIEGNAFSDSAMVVKDMRAVLGDEITYMKKDGFRNIPYSIADGYIGIPTFGYDIERDVVYYVSEKEEDRGLTLAYDVYYPTYDGAHRSVLVCIHGSGGDKDIGNYAHRNKYFAAQGYVVYDIQIGDFNEKNTNFKGFPENSKSTYLLDHIDEFFKFAVKNDTHGADFGNTFVSGVSMGGNLTLKYGLSYPNSLGELGVDLKAIVPIYPSFWPLDSGVDDFVSVIDGDTLPCMMVMGNNDTVVSPDTLWVVRDKYETVGNDGFLGVSINLAGHGLDSTYSGRANQLIMYAMERFMFRFTD